MISLSSLKAFQVRVKGSAKMLSEGVCMSPEWKKKPLYISNFPSPSEHQWISNLLLCAWFLQGWMGRKPKLRVALMPSVFHHSLWAGASFIRQCFSGQGLQTLRDSLRRTWNVLLQTQLWSTVRYIETICSASSASNYKATLAAWQRCLCISGQLHVLCEKHFRFRI